MTHLSRNAILFDAKESAQFVEVHVAKLCALDHLRVESTLEFHHVQEHLVVRPAWEQNFARVEFVQRTAD